MHLCNYTLVTHTQMKANTFPPALFNQFFSCHKLAKMFWFSEGLEKTFQMLCFNSRTHTAYLHVPLPSHTHTNRYELMSLCASAETCMRALLGLDLPQMDPTSLDRPPQAAAVASVEKTIAVHSKWMLCIGRRHVMIIWAKSAENFMLCNL